MNNKNKPKPNPDLVFPLMDIEFTFTYDNLALINIINENN